ncbi:DUF6161 domain-containing protein [Leptospira wolffii]|uniref:DUF6161 domain-containing protein n=1 Tax=Leptospira wolffii TaxID=409998 RepID=UPI0002D3101C|nr:DUF6161 domain-containing protein [Leptospira wolffii]EPG65735.1 hypothetical protein LEP1GSC061_0100 [Leptospira wolffii serovar Khorat str. Khorat-H2]
MDYEKIKDYFNSNEWEFATFLDNSKLVFRKFEDLESFIRKERTAWSYFESGRFSEIWNFYSSLENGINAISQYIIQNRFDMVQSQLSNIRNQLLSPSYQKIVSTSKLGSFLFTFDKTDHYGMSGAIDCLTGIFNGSSKEYFFGYLKTLFFLNPKILNEKFDEVLKKYDANYIHFQELITKYRSESTKELSEFKKDIQSNKDNYAAEFTKFKSDVNQAKEVEVGKFVDLRKLYEEKIRIEGPAAYWQELETHYEKKGKLWRCWAVWVSTLSVGFLTFIFFFYPEKYLNAQNGFSLDGLKGTLLLGVIISILIYLVRFFINLSLSSYHLSLDAKERYQLSHFYLSLIKEGTLQKEERNLIIQSLFGRADTGLLQGESAPTLPIDIGIFKK